MAKKWYVLHTYSGYENKVKKNLETRIETMGLENNVFGIEIPTEMVTEIKEGGRRVESEKKVFPGYVLVKMIMTDESWHLVRNVRGATGFVGTSNKAIPLTEQEIYDLGVERHEVILGFEVGDTVRVMDGPLEGFLGTVEELEPEKDRVRVVVSMFGRETPVDLELDQVEAVEN